MKTVLIATTTFLAGLVLGGALVASQSGASAGGARQAPVTATAFASPVAASQTTAMPAATTVPGAARELVMLSGNESMYTRSFDLAGDYSVEWTNSMAVATYGAPFIVRLMPASGNVAPDLLVNTAHDAGATYNGQVTLRDRRGAFYIDVQGGGLWTLTLRPITPTP